MPLIKLIALAIKALSKPIANYVRGHLQDSPTFAKVMTGIGKKYESISNRMNGTSTILITDSAAITIGSEIVVEGLFFGIGGGILLYENQISKYKTSMLENRLRTLEQKIETLKH